MRPQRMQAIDAARGIAMVLVCISHIRVHFAEVAPTLYFVLTTITRVATPTFLLLSGFVAAFVLSKNDPRVRITLLDRGLFVLVAGHLLLNLDDLRDIGFQEWVLGRVTVTDAIALCLISAVVLYRLPAKALGMAGVTLALVSWPLAMTITADSPAARYLLGALFNLQSESSAFIDAAIIPYLGVFLIGMALSKRSLQLLREADFASVAHRLTRFAMSALAIVAMGIGAWVVLKYFALTPSDPDVSRFARAALDPRSKLPPSPAYLLFYGGCGLLLTACCLVGRPRALMRPIVTWAATIGRASLMCFVLQDWLIILVPKVFQFDDVTSVAFWMLYLCLAVAVMHWIASKWDANGCNRFLSIGLRHLRSR